MNAEIPSKDHKEITHITFKVGTDLDVNIFKPRTAAIIRVKTFK
jgi:hypothetical protein